MQEPERDNLTGGERELEAALRQLAPARAGAGTGLDPVACAFEAGRQVAARRATAWQATSVVVFAVALAVVILNPLSIRSPSNVAPLVARLEPARPPSQQALSTLSVIRLRDVALERGLDAMPRTQQSAPRSLGVRDAARL
jgi:hypothetical protein